MKKEFDYIKTKQEIEDIINWFASEDRDLNEAFVKFEQAQQKLDQLQDYLKDSQAKLKLIAKKIKS